MQHVWYVHTFKTDVCRRPIKNQKISTSRSGDTDNNSDSSSNSDCEEPTSSDIDEENSDDDELV